MPNVGAPELIIILVIALIVLGPKKLPEVGRSVGKGMREFKDSLAGNDHDEIPANTPSYTPMEPTEAQPVEASVTDTPSARPVEPTAATTVEPAAAKPLSE